MAKWMIATRMKIASPVNVAGRARPMNSLKDEELIEITFTKIKRKVQYRTPYYIWFFWVIIALITLYHTLEEAFDISCSWIMYLAQIITALAAVLLFLESSGGGEEHGF